MPYGSQRGTILTVDDNVDIRTITKRFLEAAGWNVVAAADGAEGLRVYEEQRSSVVLLITDVSMPKMNGFELADRVLGMDPQLPVLFMSGEDCRAYPGSQFVAKPFRPSELLDKVNRMLNANTRLDRTPSAA
jgi:two-component system, cell cycle sensor histidine kinase and response regulator CckA